MSTAEASVTHSLIRALLYLRISDSGKLDYLTSSPSKLLEVAEASERAASRYSRGLGAIGLLLALSASELDGHPAQVETLSSIGLLCSDLGQLASTCAALARSCRSATATDEND